MSIKSGRCVVSYADGRPALVENDFGKGKAVLFAEPAELLLGNTPHAYRKDQTHRVYAYLRDLAGIAPDIVVEDPEIERSFHSDSKSEGFIVLANHHREDHRVEVTLSRPPREVLNVTSGESLAIDDRLLRVPMEAVSGAVLAVKF